MVANGSDFALNGDGVSYRFHADNTGDLVATHFGGPVTEDIVALPLPEPAGWVGLPGMVRREFPDLGRGDFRIPAFQIRQSEGYTVSDFQYQSHDVINGKPALPGLPSTFGSEDDVTTLVVHLYTKDDPEAIRQVKAKLQEASQVYSRDKECLGW